MPQPSRFAVESNQSANSVWMSIDLGNVSGQSKWPAHEKLCPHSGEHDWMQKYSARLCIGQRDRNVGQLAIDLAKVGASEALEILGHRIGSGMVAFCDGQRQMLARPRHAAEGALDVADVVGRDGMRTDLGGALVGGER